MKRFMKTSFLSLVLAVCLIAGMISPMQTQAAEKAKTKRAIAIVFDNSGSMYDGEKAWCRAIYAMEVFAAMMNEGDTLQIYPMWPIEVNGSYYEKDGKPLTISSRSDVAKIRDIFTPDAIPGYSKPINTGTPIDTIEYAAEGIESVRADEKWLIVLTDGTRFHDDDGSLLSESETKAALEERLGHYLPSMNIQYLGITVGGGRIQAPSVSVNSEYVYRADVAEKSDEVLSKLTQICNAIFGRDTLNASGEKVSFDVSMSKLIVFVQGQNIKNVSLKDSSGKEIPMAEAAYSPHYSEKGRTKKTFQVDDQLSGTIATYGALPEGEYTISYNGNAKDVQVYYEPDVDLAVRLLNADGEVADPEELCSGDYFLEYGMVDKDGNWTTSALLGKTDYSIGYKLNGKTETATATSGGRIPLTLNKDDKLEADTIKVQYLSGYVIYKSGADLGWPLGGFVVNATPVGNLKMTAQANTDMRLLTLEESTFADVTLNYEGEPLTGEALQRTSLTAEVEDGNVGTEIVRTETGYTVKLKYPGTAGETQCGPCKIKLKATFTTEEDQTAKDSETIEFNITNDIYQFDARLSADGTYYLLSDVKNHGKTFTLHLTKDGGSFSPEEMDAMNLLVELEGVAYTAEKQRDTSSYLITLQGNSELKTGKYKLTATATTGDQFRLQAEDSMKFKIALYPAWVPWLIGFLILLALFILIMIYRNTKVLPYEMRVTSDGPFTLGSMRVEDDVHFKYEGRGKKTGRLTIQSPEVVGRNESCGLVLQLRANCPRKMKGEMTAEVISVRPLAGDNVKIDIGDREFKVLHGKFGLAGDSEVSDQYAFSIGPRCDVSVNDRVPNPRGGGMITMILNAIIECR